MAEFVCWSADEDESDARPAWECRYDWETAPRLDDYDFERAAELFSERVHSDWDYPENFELFVMNTETRETRFVKVSVESGSPSFDANADSEEAAMRLFLLRYTAPARAAMEHRPRSWNWREERWARLHPEEAVAKKDEMERRRFERIDGRCPWPTGEAPDSWDEVVWPDWVPAEIRDGIQSFRSQPREYENTFASNGAQPRLGEVVTLESWVRDRDLVTGRYVGSFNQSGWVVTANGDVHRGHALYGVSSERIATLVEERRVKLLREAAKEALEAATPAALESVLRVLSENKLVEAAVYG